MPQGQETIQIKFKAVGNKSLEKAILSLAKAQKTLENSTKKVVDAQKEFGMRVPKNTDALGKQGKMFAKLQGIIAKYRNTLLLAAFAATGYSKTIGKLTSLYAKQELAEKKLSQALGVTSKRLLNYASAQQKVTVFGDEVTIQAMSQVAAFTKNEEAIEKVASAAQDMASARGMDLVTTTDLITKSIFSSTNALSRYGITIEEGLEGPERLTAILEELNEKYGGQAAAELDTYSGAVKALGNTWGDLGEGLGSVLGEALKPLIQALTSFGELLKTINPRHLANGITALSIGALLASKRFKIFRASLWESVTAMNAGAVATKTLAKSFKILMASTVAFAALEVISAFFAALSGGSKQSSKAVKVSTQTLTQFDKELIKVSNSFSGTQKILTDARKKYNDELAKTEKNLEKELEFQKKGFAITMSNMSNAEDRNSIQKKLSKLQKELNIDTANGLTGQERMNTLEERHNALLDGEHKLYKDLVKAQSQYNEMVRAQEQIKADLIPNYKKEIAMMKLERDNSGMILEAKKLLYTFEEKGLKLTKEQIQQISNLLAEKYLLIEALEEEERVTRLATEAQEMYDEVVGNIAGMSSYTKAQKQLFDARVKYLDYLESTDISKMSRIEREEYKKNKEMFKSTIGVLENQLKSLKDIGLDVLFIEEEQAIKKLDKTVKKLNNSTKTQIQLKKEEKKELEDHFKTMEVTDKRYQATADAILVLSAEISALTPKWGEYTEVVKFLNDTNFELESSMLSQKEVLENYIIQLDLMLESLEKQVKENESLKEVYELLVQLTDQLKENVKNVGKEYDFLEQIGVDALNGLHSAIVATLVEFDKINKITWDTFGDNVAQVMKQIAAQAIATGFFKIIAMLLNLGSGGLGTAMLGLMDIKHQGGEVEGYATGGLIPMQGYNSGGTISSGVDNVPIMAQEGEYVINRRAVESIGVENLNRMNRTGQASSGVNVTFSGNVMSRDFIEEEAIPQIKDAIRRGADIGIS
tara:strand:+ start:3056 stop:6022 length:2967 start_codon:yes stop_codon:yes gene_type:complete